jgi:ABC-type dipeptide/oligopeptide/nickel transport system permease component
MLSYIIRRLLLIFPTLIGMTAVVFFTIALSPGGIAGGLLSAEGGMRAAERRAVEDYMNRRFGLKEPPVVQYLRWLNSVSPIGGKERGSGFPASWKVGFKRPDLGKSFALNRPVSDVILQALPVTLLLQGSSFTLSYLIAVLIGIRAARRRGGVFDIASGTFMVGLYSVPVMWTGVMMLCYLCNQQYVQWFPVNSLHDVMADSMQFLPHFAGGFQRGWLLDTAWHLVLPMVCITYVNFAVLAKLTRAAMIDSLGQDFARTARAKGLTESAIAYRHALPNSLIPLITIAATVLPTLIAGAVITETIFGIPGMGRLVIDAIDTRDRELFLADTLLISVISLVGYLLADIAYAIVDPRVSYEGTS